MKFSTKKYLKDRSRSATYKEWKEEVRKDRLTGSREWVESFGDEGYN